MKLTELRGVVPPIATPFTNTGEVDIKSLGNLTEHLIQGGVHAIFCLGSTGECAALTDLERQTIVKTVAQVSAGRVPVLAGITETSTKRAISLGQLVIEAGAVAVVVAPPFYHFYSQDEMIQYNRDLAEALPVPIIAYNVPVLVKVPLEPATIEVLAREGTIMALKDSGGNSNIFREYVLRTKDILGFTVLTGMEFLVDTAMQMGAKGCVPGIGNVVPREYVELYELCLRGKYDEARAIQERLVGCISALRWLGIIDSAQMAPPMGTLTPEEELKVRDVLVAQGFLENGGV